MSTTIEAIMRHMVSRAKGKRDRTCAKAERVERTLSPSGKETARGVRSLVVNTVTTKRS